MALLGSTEVKDFLRETSTGYDSLIATYLPIIEEDICTYLDNWFQDNVIFVDTGGGLAFTRGDTNATASDADYITDDNDQFSTAGFAAGQDVAIEGGSNHGIHTIVTVTTAVMTMDSTGVFVSQDQDASFNNVGMIRISRMKWPDWLKPIAAKMIWYQIENNKPGGAISERIDDYSVTYVNGREYPMQILNQLVKAKQARAF